MNFVPPSTDPDLPPDPTEGRPVVPPGPPAEIALEQRALLRQILVAFVVVVLLLPLAGLGGALSWLLVPILVVAAFALRSAIRLRRSVRTHGAARGR